MLDGDTDIFETYDVKQFHIGTIENLSLYDFKGIDTSHINTSIKSDIIGITTTDDDFYLLGSIPIISDSSLVYFSKDDDNRYSLGTSIENLSAEEIAIEFIDDTLDVNILKKRFKRSLPKI